MEYFGVFLGWRKGVYWSLIIGCFLARLIGFGQSFIASNARDFAKFGKLYKDQGKWNGKQLLDPSFVSKSIQPRFPEDNMYGYGFWLSNHKNKDIFVMRGILGQYVITIPEDNLIIVRLGHKRGGFVAGNSFTEDFFIYVDEAYAMLNKA